MSLCRCIVEDNLEEVQRLLESNADVNAYEINWEIYQRLDDRPLLWLPLHTAFYYERSTIIPILLDYKADPHITDDDGRNALSAAASKNYTKYVKMFVRMGVDYHIRDKSNKNPLEWAIHFNAVESAIFLSNTMNQDMLLPFLVWLKKNKNIYHHYLFTPDALQSVAQLSKRQGIKKKAK